jgi:hypothetical protein
MSRTLRLAALLGLSAAASMSALHAPALAQKAATIAARGLPTCAQAQARVRSEGAAVIYTAPHIYDRYVAHAGFCPVGDGTRRAFAATVDDPACLIGFVCVTGETVDER